MSGPLRRGRKKVTRTSIEKWEVLTMSIGIIKEFWGFLMTRKKWWLLPVIIMLGILGLLIMFTEGSAIAPFIYTVF